MLILNVYASWILSFQTVHIPHTKKETFFGNLTSRVTSLPFKIFVFCQLRNSEKNPTWMNQEKNYSTDVKGLSFGSHKSSLKEAKKNIPPTISWMSLNKELSWMWMTLDGSFFDSFLGIQIIQTEVHRVDIQDWFLEDYEEDLCEFRTFIFSVSLNLVFFFLHSFHTSIFNDYC